ncbi:hypothetical protein K503DRAFT_854554 [Rhizopogon vinicolor AM-OR11-026]|uniref:Uncharacterized protein n=1 Tax=Rhizopogon vinicolor AM-OR11-026 TaxID=1314800 RepID=A0A1B7N9L4_9AGAM|nr:hypothetical protein K503DRAFT_854554 [Rhizopogon vinicolor AM-OR11-026]
MSSNTNRHSYVVSNQPFWEAELRATPLALPQDEEAEGGPETSGSKLVAMDYPRSDLSGVPRTCQRLVEMRMTTSDFQKISITEAVKPAGSHPFTPRQGGRYPGTRNSNPFVYLKSIYIYRRKINSSSFIRQRVIFEHERMDACDLLKGVQSKSIE